MRIKSLLHLILCVALCEMKVYVNVRHKQVQKKTVFSSERNAFLFYVADSAMRYMVYLKDSLCEGSEGVLSPPCSVLG